MYTLVRRFIKTGIVFLFTGLVLGGWLLVRRELFGIWPHPHLVSAHAHAVLVGFVLFLIFGVALWLFPRAPKDDTRYSPARVEAAYWILTLSTGSRFIAEAARAWSDAAPLPWISCSAASARSSASPPTSTRCGHASVPSAVTCANRRASASRGGWLGSRLPRASVLSAHEAIQVFLGR